MRSGLFYVQIFNLEEVNSLTSFLNTIQWLAKFIIRHRQVFRDHLRRTAFNVVTLDKVNKRAVFEKTNRR